MRRRPSISELSYIVLLTVMCRERELSTATGEPSRAHTAADSVPRHLTLAEFVLDELRKRIVLGQLAPGSRMAVDRLAEELGSSRIPVREGLRQLEAEGLVVSVPRRGVMVRDVYEQDIDDAYGLLEAAELLAAARAVERVTPEMLDRMNYWADEMLRLCDEPDPAAMLVAHRSFHFTVFDAVGNGLLLRHTKMLWNACERFVAAAISDDERGRANVEQHKEFIPLLERKDAEGLIELTRQHLQASRLRAHHALSQ